MLAASCGEPERYGYDLPPAHADGFTVVGATSSNVENDSSARRIRRIVLGELLNEPSLLVPSPGRTVRTWFLELGDSAASWVAVRVGQVGDSAVVSRSEFAIEVYTGEEDHRPPVVVKRRMASQELAEFRGLYRRAGLWQMSPYDSKGNTVDTIMCADCPPEPWCEIEIRENGRYHLVRREHNVVRGDTVGLRTTDRRFYKLCAFLRARRGGA